MFITLLGWLLTFMLAGRSLQATGNFEPRWPTAGKRRGRFGRQKWAYVATCFFQPDEFRLYGFMMTDSGVELLWQPTGSLRRRGGG